MNVAVRINSPTVIARLFKPFNTSHSGTILLEEFHAGLRMLRQGTDEEKINLVFQMYAMKGGT